MSSTRQLRGDPETRIAIRSLALRLPSGHRIASHDHGWPQLVYATRGVMTVETERGTWVVPSHRAAWIPEGVKHAITMSGAVSMRTLYLRPGLADTLPTDCCVLSVAPLLREMIRFIIGIGMLDQANPRHARLAAVLIDQVTETPEAPLELTLPRDARALRFAHLLRASPGSSRSLASFAAQSGASLRTLERLFQREAGTTVGRWRQQVRLLEALRLLAADTPVGQVALDVGYESTSAFIAMFKRTLGTTPSAYYRAGQ